MYQSIIRTLPCAADSGNTDDFVSDMICRIDAWIYTFHSSEFMKAFMCTCSLSGFAWCKGNKPWCLFVILYLISRETRPACLRICTESKSRIKEQNQRAVPAILLFMCDAQNSADMYLCVCVTSFVSARNEKQVWQSAIMYIWSYVWPEMRSKCKSLL